MAIVTLPPPPPITLEWIEEQEAFHKGKLASLAALKTAYLNVAASPEAQLHTPQPKPVINAVSGTKKAAILRAIAGPANGLATQEIVSACINAGFSDTNQSNTSPQLSLYKSKGDIRLADGRWIITEQGRAYLAAQKN